MRGWSAWCAVAAAWVALGCSDDRGSRRPAGLDGNTITWDGDRPGLDAGRDTGPRDSGPAPDAAGDAGSPSDADAGSNDPCLEPPMTSITAEEAVRDEALLDQVIEVRGHLATGDLACTRPPCGDDDPCCQTCAAPLLMDGVLPLGTSACRDAPVGCSGSNCATTCSPPVLGGSIRVVGRLVSGDDGPVLEVWSTTP